MIEREFVSEKIKHFKIKELIDSRIRKFAGVGDIVIERTPMGEKIIIYAVRPGLIIGRGGETVKELTFLLKTKFNLENPQIEIKEVAEPTSYAAIVAKKIASDMERFGSSRFKMLAYKALTAIMKAGAMGAEIRITGRGVPGARAKSWLFREGYLKKCGDVALTQVDKTYATAHLRATTVGIKVSIMHGDAVLPDRVKVLPGPKVEEVKVTEAEAKAEVKQAEEIEAEQAKITVEKEIEVKVEEAKEEKAEIGEEKKGKKVIGKKETKEVKKEKAAPKKSVKSKLQAKRTKESKEDMLKKVEIKEGK